jgi:hypothetical protein
MNNFNEQKLINLLAIYSSEFDIYKTDYDQELKHYNKIHASYMADQELLLSEKFEAEMKSKERRENLLFRQQYRDVSNIKNNPNGGYGGFHKKLFNILVERLYVFFTSKNGKTDWRSIVIILVDTPEILWPVLPYRDEIKNEHLEYYLKKRDYAVLPISTVHISEYQLTQDYKKLHTIYLHIETFNDIVNSLRKTLPKSK